MAKIKNKDLARKEEEEDKNSQSSNQAGKEIEIRPASKGSVTSKKVLSSRALSPMPTTTIKSPKISDNHLKIETSNSKFKMKSASSKKERNGEYNDDRSSSKDLDSGSEKDGISAAADEEEPDSGALRKKRMDEIL